MIQSLAEVRKSPYIHGRCFIAAHGIASFVGLPNEQTDTITLGDIGPKAAKAIIAVRSPTVDMGFAFFEWYNRLEELSLEWLAPEAAWRSMIANQIMQEE
jgi:hypothetical protein